MSRALPLQPLPLHALSPATPPPHAPSPASPFSCTPFPCRPFTFLTIYNVIRNQYFYLGETVLYEVPSAANFVAANPNPHPHPHPHPHPNPNRRYEGMWKGGKKEGRGTMSFPNTASYEGRFRSG